MRAPPSMNKRCSLRSGDKYINDSMAVSRMKPMSAVHLRRAHLLLLIIMLAAVKYQAHRKSREIIGRRVAGGAGWVFSMRR